MTTPAIEAAGLVKRYGDVTAVSGIDLVVPARQIYALLGPNGAGKTTTINMLTTLTLPTDGSARVVGYDIVREARRVREHIGVTFQDIVLDQDLTGRRVLDVHGQLYRLNKDERRRRIVDLVDLVQLNDAIDRPVKTYSGGMKRRLELARGLLTNPDVLFLDEPTQGLDPQNRVGIWQYIRELNRARGLTLLLTTHYMEEAEELAHKVGIIDHGKMAADGAVGDLIAGMGADVIRIKGRGDCQQLARHLDGRTYVERVQCDAQDGAVTIHVDNGNRRLAEIVNAASSNGLNIDDISVARPGLGDVFLHYTGHALRD